MRPTRHAYEKRGFGTVLAVVLVFLMILFVMAIAQSLFSSQVLDDTGRAFVGRRCVNLAESATEETFYLVQGLVNEPGNKAFDQFRDCVKDGKGQAIRIKIDPKGLVQTWGIVNGLYDYHLETVEAEAIWHAPLNKVHYERYGLLKIAAVISNDAYSQGFHTFKRRVEVYRDFKIVKVTPPRPFDRFTLVVRNCEGLLGPGAVNEDIRGAYRSLRGDWAKSTVQTRYEKMRKDLGKAPGDIKGIDECKRLLDEGIDTEGKYAPSRRFDGQLFAGKPTEKEKLPHLFGYARSHLVPRASSLAVVSAVLKLENLGTRLAIAQKVKELGFDRMKAEQERDKALGEVLQAVKKFKKDNEGATSTSQIDATPVADTLKGLVEARKKELGTADAFLKRIFTFQSSVGEKYGLHKKEALGRWEENYFRRKLTLTWWKRNATYTVANQGALRRLLEAVSPINGVIFVEGNLTLDGSLPPIRGKVILVAEGDLEAKNYAPPGHDEKRDALTVISFGGDATLGGTVRASIILAPKGSPDRDKAIRVWADPKVLIQGNLIVSGELRPKDWVDFAIERNPMLDGGAHGGQPSKKGHFLVAVSPQVSVRRVKR